MLEDLVFKTESNVTTQTFTNPERKSLFSDLQWTQPLVILTAPFLWDWEFLIDIKTKH